MRDYDQCHIEVAMDSMYVEHREAHTMEHLPAVEIDHTPTDVQYNHHIGTKRCKYKLITLLQHIFSDVWHNTDPGTEFTL